MVNDPTPRLRCRAIHACLLFALLPWVGNLAAQENPAPSIAIAPRTQAPVDAPMSGAERVRAEATAKDALEALRSEQRAATAAEEAGRSARAQAQRDIHAADEALAAASRQAHELGLRIAGLDRELGVLAQRRARLDARIDRQRAALGALLRSAHALGRHRQLKTLLGFDQDAGATGRLLAYHRIIERDHSRRLREIARDARALAAVQRAVALNREHWKIAAASQRTAVATLETARASRQARLGTIESRIGAHAERLLALKRDEAGLLQLLARLTDAIADIPRVLEDSQPLSALKGKLPWPITGRVLTPFGATLAGGEPSGGVLIAAKSGAPVAAVAHGRVAYADWLKGYGLVLILDHGDGFMTLYAHAEALLKDVGDWVTRDDPIATAGASGGRRETGLYFELRREGLPQDPAAWLARR